MWGPSAFAVESIRYWWTHMGQESYSNDLQPFDYS